MDEPTDRPPSQRGILPPLAARLDPATPLHRSGRSIAKGARGTAGDFWAWAFSDLRQNSTRGHLAEYLVAQALGVELTVRSAWDDYDLALGDRLVPYSKGAARPARVQVKSSAYLQAWGQKALSVPKFGGLRRRPFPWDVERGFRLGETKAPKADVFVFALQTAQDHAAYDALDLDQWEFRVLPAHRVNQDSIGYPTLCRMAEAVRFEALAEAVTTAVRERVQKLAGILAQLTKAQQRGDVERVTELQRVIDELEA